MKRPLLFFPLFAVVLAAVFGCEAGRDKAVTGDYFDRTRGKPEYTTAVFDSVKNFGGAFSYPSNAIAGIYGKTSAFAVFKFTTPASAVISGLEKIRVKFTVAGIWKEGERSFGLWPASVDWTDTTRLDRDSFLAGLGDPLVTWSDTVATVNTMTFDLAGQEAADLVKSWGTYGGLLLKEAPGAHAMVNVYTAFSSAIPTIEYIAQISGAPDTTRINSSSSAYAFDNGYVEIFPGRTGILSDGNAGGFVLYLSLPDSFPRTNTVNGAMLVLPIVQNDIPSGETMNIEMEMLTAGFTILSEAQTSSSYSSDYTISPTDTKIEVDITKILSVWTAAKASNHGILFKSTKTGTSPAQIVIAPPDSVEITYTTIPEVK